jgi:hypothetical protein
MADPAEKSNNAQGGSASGKRDYYSDANQNCCHNAGITEAINNRENIKGIERGHLNKAENQDGLPQ